MDTIVFKPEEADIADNYSQNKPDKTDPEYLLTEINKKEFKEVWDHISMDSVKKEPAHLLKYRETANDTSLINEVVDVPNGNTDSKRHLNLPVDVPYVKTELLDSDGEDCTIKVTIEPMQVLEDDEIAEAAMYADDICSRYLQVELREEVSYSGDTRSAEFSIGEGKIKSNGKQFMNVSDRPDKCHVCNVCTKTFKQRGELSKHILIHTGEKPHRCEVCSKSFSQKSNLSKHLVIHTGRRPHSCHICFKSFTEKSNLLQHLVIHTGEKSHQCTICSKYFAHKSDLTKHMSIHTGHRPHMCDICFKTFREKCKLSRHMMVHAERPPQHPCDVCFKTFNLKSNLAKHILIHTGEKPYKCDVCTKCFTKKFDLIRHTFVHTNQKPYQCDLCSKSFTQKANIAKHLIQSHISLFRRTKKVQKSIVTERKDQLVI